MKKNDYFLSSSRIGFRQWRENDLELAYNLWGDYEVTRLFDRRGKLSKEQVKERLGNEIRMQKEHGVQYWPVFLLAGDDHIGACGLRPYDTENRIFEIGFHIRSCCWGNGYATEASLRVITYAFTTLRAKGLFAGHNPKNDASRHLLIKLGFTYTHDAYYEPTGLDHPSYLLTKPQ